MGEPSWSPTPPLAPLPIEKSLGVGGGGARKPRPPAEPAFLPSGEAPLKSSSSLICGAAVVVLVMVLEALLEVLEVPEPRNGMGPGPRDLRIEFDGNRLDWRSRDVLDMAADFFLLRDQLG